MKEIKLKVNNLKSIETLCTKLSTDDPKIHSEKDTYFYGTNLKINNFLRIRQASYGTYITFKGDPIVENKVTNRKEYETKVMNDNETFEIFKALGYKIELVIEKKRIYYKIKECTVVCDHVSTLGEFVEIEGPSVEEVRKVMSLLDLKDEQVESQGYAVLMYEHMYG